MPCPDTCLETIYSIMLGCWAEPELRPTFAELVDQIEHMTGFVRKLSMNPESYISSRASKSTLPLVQPIAETAVDVVADGARKSSGSIVYAVPDRFADGTPMNDVPQPTRKPSKLVYAIPDIELLHGENDKRSHSPASEVKITIPNEYATDIHVRDHIFALAHSLTCPCRS